MGQFATLLYIIFCIMSSHWVLLLLAPFVVYPFAWSGHIFFEKNDPLAWKGISDYGATTLKAKICDLFMLKDWLMGRIER